MKKNCLLLCLLCLSLITYSQTRQVTGLVSKSNSSDTLTAVSVTVKGTNIATSTNAEGRYTINVPARNNLVLVFSSVGFKAQEVKIGTNSVVDVSLVE